MVILSLVQVQRTTLPLDWSYDDSLFNLFLQTALVALFFLIFSVVKLIAYVPALGQLSNLIFNEMLQFQTNLRD